MHTQPPYPFTCRLVNDLCPGQALTGYIDEPALARLDFGNDFYRTAIHDLYAFETFKARALDHLRRQPAALIDPEEEQRLYAQAQAVIHLPLEQFRELPFQARPHLLTVKAQWTWNTLPLLWRRFSKWDYFFENSYGENTIFLRYNHEFGDFFESSDSGWGFILETLRTEAASLAEFSEALSGSAEIGADLSPDKIEERLFESMRYLVYWGFLQRA